MNKRPLFLLVLLHATYCLCNAQVPSYMPLNGLVASFPFSGNANDASGNKRNGTIVGATLTSDRFGNANSAYQFNGSGNYIDCGNSFEYSSHSFVFWAKYKLSTVTVDDILPVVSKLNNGPFDTKNSELGITGFTLGNGTAWMNVSGRPSSPNYTQWNLYVGTYDASSHKLTYYFNGMMSSTVISGNYFDVANTPLYIGARPYWSGSAGTTFFFDGDIDDVHIYNRALTNTEVRNIYYRSAQLRPDVSPAATMHIIAGTTELGFSGDGGPATSAQFYDPIGLCKDRTGNIYIADYANNRVRRISPAGIVQTVAGNGTASFGGDSGPAINASLNGPVGVAVDRAGNLYIGDYRNNRVRKVDTKGIITTVAGNGNYGVSGNGGPAISSSLNLPSGLHVDNFNNLYIADQGNHMVRKVDGKGIITTVAGNGMAGFSGDGGPAINASLMNVTGVATDPAGNLYLVCFNDHRVRKVDVNGIISTYAGTGVAGYNGDNIPATTAQLSGAYSVCTDKRGNVYIADQANGRIRVVDMYGIITTIAGADTSGIHGDGLPPTRTILGGPPDVEVDANGNVYLTDSGRRVRTFHPQKRPARRNKLHRR